MLIKKFKIFFRKEYEQYCLLFEKAEAKQKAILENDIDKLAELVGEEQTLLNEIDELEEERHKLLSELVPERESSEDIISFNELLDFMPEERKEMKELKADFLLILEKIQKVNEENRVLIEDSLKLTDYSLQVIRQTVDKGSMYNKTDDSDDQGEHIIDEKI